MAKRARAMGEGPYETDPDQEEASGFFDGITQGRSLIMRRCRTALAPLGLTVNRGAFLVAISDSEPIPESVGCLPDNPFQNLHYDLGYRCGVFAAPRLFSPPANYLLSHVEMSLADNGVVTSTARTAELASRFIAQRRRVAAPEVVTAEAAEALLRLFQNPAQRAALMRSVPRDFRLETADRPAPASMDRSALVSRRSVLAGACAGLILSVSFGILALKGGSSEGTSAGLAQTAALRPAEHWNVFHPILQPTFQLIDQWIVNRYSVGAYGEVATVIQGLMASLGNMESKNLAAVYVCRSERWELTRLLLPALDPAISSVSPRRNVLIAVRRALKYTGGQYFSSYERTVIQNYLASAVETNQFCIDEAQRVLSLMSQAGL